MNQNKKIAIVHGIVGVVCFVLALLFFNSRLNVDKKSAVAEMANPSYPVLEVKSGVSSYNLMSGYRDAIDLSLVRNQVTLTNGNNSLELQLHNYNYDITAIQYSLFEKNPEKPLETGTLNRLKENGKKRTRNGKITFTSNLRQGAVYYLKLAVRLDNSTRIFYYTKVQNGATVPLDEYLTFALTFHNNLFDKAKMEENAGYLDITSNVTGNNLSSVNIRSGSAAVSFGNMKVKQETAPRINVQEANDTYTVIKMNTLLSSEISEGIVQYYNLEETYKLRYTTERMYLLDYERTMNAYYNEEIIDSGDNMISLGIQNEKDVSFLSSDKGYKVCFVQQEQLWYYDYQSSDIYKVYSLSSDNLSDLRNVTQDHGIKILSMDDSGNIVYLVYGYISRGRHEGMNGIEIMEYNAKTNCNKELSFLSSSTPYESMKEDLNRLSYLNADHVFYCLLSGDLHQVDIKEKKDEILKSGIVDDGLTASKDQSIIALEKDRDRRENREIEMIDLATGKSHVITCDSDSRIRGIGFLSRDFIYGQAEASDVTKDSGGAVIFPSRYVHIVDMEGNQIKNYEKPGRYVLDTRIKGSVLEMALGKKNGKTMLKLQEKDFIRYKEEEGKDAVTLSTKYSDTFWTQLYMKFPNYVYIQVVPDLLLTKTVVNEDDVSLKLKESGEKPKQYFVYASGEKQGVYSTVSEAIAKADEARGNVIDSEENVLWNCVFPSYAQVAGMEEVVKTGSDEKSLAGCLSMIASVNGKEISPERIETEGESVASLMKKYSGSETLSLTGCSVDEILYYVSQGSPVLTKYDKNRYVIVMSYNATKLRYLDPVTGKSTAVSRPELTKKLEKAGKVFYSYMEKE